MCSSMYRPVCGANGKTYSNNCKAKVAGTTVVSKGRCPRRRVCSTIDRPVCGSNGKTYSNGCKARVAGATVVSKGVCTKSGFTFDMNTASVTDAEAVTSEMNTESTRLRLQ